MTRTVTDLSDGGDVVNGQVGGAEGVRAVEEWVSLALDEDGASDRHAGLRAHHRHDVLTLLLVADFLSGGPML
jgi:hypothetical protein